MKKSAIAIVRRPVLDATSNVAPSATSTGNVSPAGDAVPRLPPIVPALRIWGEPTVRAAYASAGEPEHRLALELREGCRGPDHDVGTFDADTAQLGQSTDGHDPRERSASVVDLDHEIGSAREDRRVGIRGQRRERGFE